MDVRRIEVGEGARLRALRLAALEADPDAFGSSHEREVAYEARDWDMLGGGPGAVFVGGAWEGMAGVYLEDDEPRLWGLWVAPGARGRGLGRALAEAVAGWARDRAFARLRLGVTAAAPAALRLYERLGYERTGAARPLRPRASSGSSSTRPTRAAATRPRRPARCSSSRSARSPCTA